MGTRKKGSELVFNLQWRNMPDNGGDRSNVVGMYDTPATTLNFETFKSYLLKNSGVLGNDVKVTYLTDTGAEWIIDSQEWFEIALCAFRLKARLGEVIFLKLDKISNHHQMMRKHSNDVETQFDNDSATNNFNAPPEWFLVYMKQFKRELVEEVTYTVSSNLVANSKEKEHPAPPPPVVLPPKKVKSDSSKRTRKHMLLGETPIDKELLKTLKFDRKLEIKLDKLDAKTKKIKEKKQALICKLEQTEEQHGKHSQIPVDSDGIPLMNASLMTESSVIPHMVGGETYLHSWEVLNSGQLPWTSKTQLRLTWGSAEMKPATNVVQCPPLQPGAKGTICVRFQIPLKSGQYESYWNFYDRDVRFGHWLSCCVIVDGPINYLFEKTLTKKPKIEQEQQQYQPDVMPDQKVSGFQLVETEEVKPNSPKQFVSQENFVIVQENSADSEIEGAVGVSSNVIDLSRRMQDIKIVGTSQADSDSDWESLWSYGGPRKPKNADGNNVADGELRKSNKYGINEKDLIVDLSTTKESKFPSPRQSPTAASAENLKQEITQQNEENLISNDDNNNNGESVNNTCSGESICEVASEASSDISSGYDVIHTPVCEEKEDSGYVYITIDGNKLPVPKHILRPDFLAGAEEAPGPANLEDEDKATIADTQDKENVREEPTASAAKLESQIQELEQEIQDTKSFMSHCSAAGTCFSDSSVTPGGTRLFIFPQTNPGYEVVYPKLDIEGETVTCPTNKVETVKAEPMQTYTWSHSDSQYTFGDVQNVCSNKTTSGQLRYDPYGPLDQSRPTSPQGLNQTFPHVPNYQQSHPRRCSMPPHKPKTPTAPPPPPPHRTPTTPTQSTPVHILPENLVSGAVNVASSAINTARSVINMIVPPKSEPGKWVNGHWVTENQQSTRAKNICILADMGFWDTDLNATLLARYNDDVSRVVSELLQ